SNMSQHRAALPASPELSDVYQSPKRGPQTRHEAASFPLVAQTLGKPNDEMDAAKGLYKDCSSALFSEHFDCVCAVIGAGDSAEWSLSSFWIRPQIAQLREDAVLRITPRAVARRRRNAKIASKPSAHGSGTSDPSAGAAGMDW